MTEQKGSFFYHPLINEKNDKEVKCMYVGNEWFADTEESGGVCAGQSALDETDENIHLLCPIRPKMCYFVQLSQ